jgi:hypothetical protein
MSRWSVNDSQNAMKNGTTKKVTKKMIAGVEKIQAIIVSLC